MSKNGELDGGGDRLILGCRFRGVVDAATEKFGRTWVIAGQEMSGERAMATVLGQYLTESSEPLWDILKAVQRSDHIVVACISGEIEHDKFGCFAAALHRDEPWLLKCDRVSTRDLHSVYQAPPLDHVNPRASPLPQSMRNLP